MSQAGRRLIEAFAVAAAGDGLATLLFPRRHVALWRAGPEPWRRAMEALESRPRLTAVLGGVQTAAALWVVHRQTRAPTPRA